MIKRFSSRQQKLDQVFLNQKLSNAQAYDRIAGYFSSSMLEIAGETIESMSGSVRLVCNSDLELKDVETARAAQYALRREWCAARPEELGERSQSRFARLYDFLRSGKLEVRVLPREKFGLVHGKAGVITLADGSQTSFIGSTNETYAAWKLNYELLWEDDSPEAINWVQEEFEAFWNSPHAVDLADFVIEDIGRIARRELISSVDDWADDPQPAATVIETPVFRKEYGLWEHQKYFVKLAFDAHRGPFGARYVLADQVGLGKTVQLALSAQLMALYGNKPILILAPKTLLWQWQGEMLSLLDMPSAVWNGKQWVDENGIEYPATGPENIRRCPRRVGLVSQGLVTRGSEAVEYLKAMNYECIIVDEAHRARRRNLGPNKLNENPDANNLYAFLREISPRTRSMLLATATPVQMYPIEAWDLLNMLSNGNEHVLGNEYSPWRHQVEAIDVVMGNSSIGEDELEQWNWIRNPLAPSSEDRDFELLRRSLKISDSQAVVPGDVWMTMREPDRERIRRLARDFAAEHNPFIQHIVRRDRKYLETTIDPETNEPYLKPIKVNTLGESDSEAIILTPYLKDAYSLAEEFCQLLGQRMKGSGFLKTLLLRRVGSTTYAGKLTAERMLSEWRGIEDDYEEDDEPEENEVMAAAELKTLTGQEAALLRTFVETLQANQDQDPKYKVVMDCLRNRGWLAKGCIIFSQYFDSLWWLAENLSKDLPGEKIGIYAGGQRSGIICDGLFNRISRDEIKLMVARGELRLLLGTDAASEGLNLQRLGTLINLDLPWNPTRLEQRKGRIQRIGQIRDEVDIYNMRYKDSVEDRVHDLLSDRLENIYNLFGQIPDVLEDVWVNVALGEIEKARQTIDAVPRQNPFEIRYQRIEKVPWESCSQVLDNRERRQHLMKAW